MSPIEPGLAALNALSVNLKQEYDTPEEDAEWAGHTLAWIRTKPPARIGKIGRLFVFGLCQNNGHEVQRVGYSLFVEKKLRMSVRFSTGWSGGGFSFEQLRNEAYDVIFCLGITPHGAFAWVIPKSAIFSKLGVLLLKEGLTIQHKGKKGSDTAWINFDIQSVPSWMTQYGGSVESAMNTLKGII